MRKVLNSKPVVFLHEGDNRGWNHTGVGRWNLTCNKGLPRIAFAALGIPAYLAYTAREQNILAKSRLYDRDLFLMIVISAAVILAFNYFFDPRAGLIILALAVPLIALYADRLKTRKKVQNA